VARVSTRAAIRALLSHPEAFDVVVCARPVLVALAELPWCLDPHRVLAWGRPPRRVLASTARATAPPAGHRRQGVADPSSMLLAAALMLEGLGERGAGGHALVGRLARRTANGSRRAGRHRLDVERAHRRGARAAAAVALERRVPREAV
jgi:isocitrate/isopropylmalate dehydrogenase